MDYDHDVELYYLGINCCCLPSNEQHFSLICGETVHIVGKQIELLGWRGGRLYTHRKTSYPEMTLHLLICISKMAATVCIFYMIYIEDNFYNCMHVNRRNWKWDFELSQIKWDKNEWQPWNIRGSWSVWKSEAANPYTGLNSLCNMSEIYEIGGVRHQIYQRIIQSRVTGNIMYNLVTGNIMYNLESQATLCTI